MKRKCLLWISAFLLTTVGMISCSDDELDGLRDNQATFKTDLYSIGYSLKNTKGERTSTFKEGENIIFDVVIYNTIGNEIGLADERYILMGAASVYHSNGEYVGNPWQSAFQTFELRWIHIKANDYVHWSFPWIYDEGYASASSISTKVLSPMDPLPKGSYYSMIKGSIMKHDMGSDVSGHDDIEMRIPFIVE